MKNTKMFRHFFSITLISSLFFTASFGMVFAKPTPTPASGSSIAQVDTYGNFETAGVNIKVNSMNFNESATVEYKKTTDSVYKAGHNFVRYDGNHMATSLFNLALNTTYNVKITLSDPDGVTGTNPYYTTVTTKPEFSIPTPLRIVNVANQTELNTAISNAIPGDEIRLAAGTYASGISLTSKSGTSANPIVFSSQTSTKPLLTGSAYLYSSNYIVLNNLEIHNEAGLGVNISGGNHDVVTNCYIHDSSPLNYSANVAIQHSDAGTFGIGYNLILNNILSDEVHDPMDDNQGPGGSNTGTSGQLYYAINIINNPGAFDTIRGNTIYGTVDGAHTGGDEGTSPIMGPNDLDLLNTYPEQNLDFYDNVIYDVKDDCIESDGHTVNGRFFRNRLGKCENAISVATTYPGPLFFIRNYSHGFHQGCIKQNNTSTAISRNAFFYNNTFMEKLRETPQHCGTEYCLYRGEPMLEQDFTYKNNIFYARGRVYNGDMYTRGNYHKNDIFDYNCLYSTRQTDSIDIIKWVCVYGDALNNTHYSDLASFRSATGQELNGIYADPLLNTTPLTGYPAVSKLLDLRISAGSPAINTGVVIPGICDTYNGTGPDMGAYEY